MRSPANARFVYLITVLSPVIAAYFAIRNLGWDQRKWVLIFITTLFGATIILQSSDGSVLLQMIYDHYVGLSFDRWLFELKEILVFSPEAGTKGDVFSHVFSYLFGEVLGFPGLYFTFVSFIYGYFFITALSKILHWDPSIPRTNLFWVLIFIFVTYRFVDNLQTVRTWTGLWVLFTGVYGYHQTGKVRYLFVMLLSPLFHLAYFVIAIPAFVSLISKYVNPKFFIIVYAFSFFVAIDESGIISELETTDLGKEKVAGYYREDPDDYGDPTKDQSANWYRKYGKGWALPNAPNILAVSLILTGLVSRRKMNNLEIGLFTTGLMIATLANLGGFIPAFYNRTMINAGIYVLATVVLLLLRGELFNTDGWRLQWRLLMFKGSVIVFFPYVVYVVANMLQFTSVFMVGIPIFGFFSDFNVSIREFIGDVF